MRLEMKLLKHSLLPLKCLWMYMDMYMCMNILSSPSLQGLDGEILVTARTDPGWVPLYPLCSGLVIERGR